MHYICNCNGNPLIIKYILEKAAAINNNNSSGKYLLQLVSFNVSDQIKVQVVFILMCLGSKTKQDFFGQCKQVCEFFLPQIIQDF